MKIIYKNTEIMSLLVPIKDKKDLVLVLRFIDLKRIKKMKLYSSSDFSLKEAIRDFYGEE